MQCDRDSREDAAKPEQPQQQADLHDDKPAGVVNAQCCLQEATSAWQSRRGGCRALRGGGGAYTVMTADHQWNIMRRGACMDLGLPSMVFNTTSSSSARCSGCSLVGCASWFPMLCSTGGRSSYRYINAQPASAVRLVLPLILTCLYCDQWASHHVVRNCLSDKLACAHELGGVSWRCKCVVCFH